MTLRCRAATAVVCVAPFAAATGSAAQTAADSAWTAGDIARAETLYAAALARADSSPRALHRLALIRAWSEDYDASLSLFERLLAVSPDDLEAALDRARVLSWRDDLDRAAEAYAAVLEEHGDSRDARLGLARVRAWGGDLDAAERMYAAILARDPDDVEALGGYARVAAWDGRLDAAEARWRAALERHPNDPSLLVGLGGTLRWSGRPTAALDPLARAVDLAPGDEDARDEYRLARLAIAPRIGPSLVYESDSDGNRMTTLWLDHAVWPTRHLGVSASGYARTAWVAGGGPSGSAEGGLLELRLRTPAGWELEAGGGATHSGLSEAGARPQWRVRAATPGRLPVQVWARVWHRALDETAPLMRAGVELRERSLGARAALGRVRAEATLDHATFAGERSNRRRSASLGITRTFAGGWRVGLGARALGFDDDLAEGYFDPSFYGLAEARVGWEDRFGAWHVSAEAAPGVQRVGYDPGSTSASVRTRLSVGREFGPGKVVWLHTGFASSGIRSFSTAGADYRYYQAALALGWAF